MGALLRKEWYVMGRTVVQITALWVVIAALFAWIGDKRASASCWRRGLPGPSGCPCGSMTGGGGGCTAERRELNWVETQSKSRKFAAFLAKAQNFIFPY